MPMTTASSHLQSIHLQSEAFESFANDFALMKKTILQLSHKLSQQTDRVTNLEIDVDGLKTENLKLLTDMKVLRNEHQEVLNSLFTQERRNSTLVAENEALKRMILNSKGDTLQYSVDDHKPTPLKGEPIRSQDQRQTESSQNERQGYSGDLVSFQRLGLAK